MRRKKLFWKLFQSYLLITTISLVVLALSSVAFIRHLHYQQTRDGLSTCAVSFRRLVAGDLHENRRDAIDDMTGEMAADLGIRLTVILPNGVVIADSEEDHRLMDNHADRPEIRQAFGREEGVSIRYSYTLKKELMYVAVPVSGSDGNVSAVVRASMPVTSISSALKPFYLKFTLVLGLIIAVSVVMSLFIAGRINKPIMNMSRGVKRFADGDLDYRVPRGGTAELFSLAEAINHMAAQLRERIRTVTEQRNELNAVLTGMAEAVIAVNADDRIVEFNRTACELFDVGVTDVRGMHIQEVIRNRGLREFIGKTRDSEGLIDEELAVRDERERVFQAHGSRIEDAGGETISIIVLNDITELKKLAAVRRDFVANVSHELKTPITSIIGFVETLKDGAVEDRRNRDQFLDIILRHAERLNGIIDDLLSLSRIEGISEEGSIRFERHNLCELLAHTVALREHLAVEKDISIILDCRDTALSCNGTLMEQAVANLIDNAVRYSDRGGEVRIGVEHRDGNVVIEVGDTGCGIAEEHIPRIFERFYCVDKGRSRERCGTGLGLAIVKHIVNLHRGRITVDSAPGRGSVFSIILPGE